MYNNCRRFNHAAAVPRCSLLKILFTKKLYTNQLKMTMSRCALTQIRIMYV